MAAFAAAACDKSKSEPSAQVQLGEPIGAQLDATAKVPALQVAFAVTKGQDPVPFLAPFVGVLSQSVAACPAFVEEGKKSGSDVSAVDFTIEQGKVKPVMRPEQTPGTACVAGALAGKDVGNATTPKLNARAEIKMTAATPKP